MEIIVDTREQSPLWVIDTVVQTLNVGDYTTKLLLGKFHAERKSPQDLYGSIIQGHERFKSMFLRAYAQQIQVPVYVECQERTFYAKRWPQGFRRKTPGTVLAKIICTLSKKYGIRFVFCKGRADMRIKMKAEFNHQESLLTKP